MSVLKTADFIGLKAQSPTKWLKFRQVVAASSDKVS
jgi:hypothetical protein